MKTRMIEWALGSMTTAIAMAAAFALTIGTAGLAPGSAEAAQLCGAKKGAPKPATVDPTCGKPAPEKAAGAEKAPMAFDAPPAIGAKATCPVMGHEFTVSERTQRSEYKGKHYAFCCPGCKPQFDEAPQKFLGADKKG